MLKDNMPPTQKPAGPPADYDFILQSAQPKKRRLSFGGTKRQRIAVMIVLVLVLIVAAYGFLAIVRSQGNKGNGELVDLAAYQTELARVADLGNKADSTMVKANSKTAALSLLSDLVTTKKLLSSRGIAYATEDLNKYKTTTIDQQLDAAKKANNFDATFSTLLDEKLSNYIEKLTSVFSAQTNPTVQDTLRTFKVHAELLPFSYSSND